MVFSGEGSFYQIVNFLMALGDSFATSITFSPTYHLAYVGNTYGIFIIIILMGSGLVGLPRRLWYHFIHNNSSTHSFMTRFRYSSDNEIELIRLYISSNSIESAYQEARYELEECEYDVGKLVENLSKDSIHGDLLKYGHSFTN